MRTFSLLTQSYKTVDEIEPQLEDVRGVEIVKLLEE
jgi:hypothetical protein